MVESTKQDQSECPACKRKGLACQIWVDRYGSWKLSWVRCEEDGKRHHMDDIFDTEEEFKEWVVESKNKPRRGQMDG